MRYRMGVVRGSAKPCQFVKTAIVYRHEKLDDLFLEALAVDVWDDVGLGRL